jgi:hypothetical protein
MGKKMAVGRKTQVHAAAVPVFFPNARVPMAAMGQQVNAAKATFKVRIMMFDA